MGEFEEIWDEDMEHEYADPCPERGGWVTWLVVCALFLLVALCGGALR